MSDQLPRSPPILECRWGLIRIDGHGTVKDAKLYPGGARAWDWRETGTRHRPGIQPADAAELVEHGAMTVVLAIGVLRMLGVCSETLQELQCQRRAGRGAADAGRRYDVQSTCCLRGGGGRADPLHLLN